MGVTLEELHWMSHWRCHTEGHTGGVALDVTLEEVSSNWQPLSTLFITHMAEQGVSGGYKGRCWHQCVWVPISAVLLTCWVTLGRLLGYSVLSISSCVKQGSLGARVVLLGLSTAPWPQARHSRSVVSVLGALSATPVTVTTVPCSSVALLGFRVPPGW